MNYKLSEIVAKLGGQLIGDDKLVTGIAPTGLANSSQITFITDDKYKKNLESCQAGSIILNNQTLSTVVELKMSKIVTANPYLYMSQVSNLFHPQKLLESGVASTATIAKSAKLGKNCAISSGVIIGENVLIGDNCQIHPNTVIGDNVVIGNDVIFYPNVTIYANVTIGNLCAFHSGVVIGSDGFGYAPDNKKEYHKIPQIGGVVIGNQVEVGANTTIDCGTFEPTVIEDGVIIDNLVQIAHNVKIGAHTAIAACVGIAGSTTIGKYCTLAGGCGISGHINICDHTIIGAITGIGKSITKPDLYMAAYPFSNYKDYARNAVHIRNLNEMHQRVKSLEQQIKQILGDKDVSR